MGKVRLFSKESYLKYYGREPQEDNVFPESFTSPNGVTFPAYKASICSQQISCGVFCLGKVQCRLYGVVGLVWVFWW